MRLFDRFLATIYRALRDAENRQWKRRNVPAAYLQEIVKALEPLSRHDYTTTPRPPAWMDPSVHIKRPVKGVGALHSPAGLGWHEAKGGR